MLNHAPGLLCIGQCSTVALSSAISQCQSLACFSQGASPDAELEVDKINLVDKAMQTEGEVYSLIRFFFFLFCPNGDTGNSWQVNVDRLGEHKL